MHEITSRVITNKTVIFGEMRILFEICLMPGKTPSRKVSGNCWIVSRCRPGACPGELHGFEVVGVLNKYVARIGVIPEKELWVIGPESRFATRLHLLYILNSVEKFIGLLNKWKMPRIRQHHQLCIRNSFSNCLCCP